MSEENVEEKLQAQIEEAKTNCKTAQKAGDKPTALKFLHEMKAFEKQLEEYKAGGHKQ